MHRQDYVANSGRALHVTRSELAELMQAVIARGRLFRFRARGWSMSPFVKDGDVIVLAPVLASGPRRGDIVAFRLPASPDLTVHRVIDHKPNCYLTRGDNSTTTDGLVHRRDILARVLSIERRRRRVKLGLGPERSVIALLSGAGLLIPIVNTLRKMNPLGRMIQREYR